MRLGDTIVPVGITLDTGSDERDGPMVTATFEVRDGRPECVHLAVTARPGGRGIRLRDLDMFTLDGLMESTFAKYAIPADDASGPEGGRGSASDEQRFLGPAEKPDVGRYETAEEVAHQARVRQAAQRDLAAARARRRRPSRQEELERVAEVYSEHIEGHPAEAVRLRLGYGSASTAARRIKQAEEAGLLPPTTTGRKRRA